MRQAAIRENIAQLNQRYGKMDVYERVENLYKDFDASEIMLTSSFAATSAFLLLIRVITLKRH